MSHSVPPADSARPASAVNAEIRALWSRTRGTLSEVEAARYERLLVEWAAAVRTDAQEAA
ncbi:hypothetical protein [Streptomyces sp. NBC_01465]|uniref:hypothetical protein n=1 Tax=Streptomyces sp. NBC_01465 TaxID=2903878 RepID=UPI002E37DD25|nr:hypothetical protein [Streptomyces sp. NBC_01465]